MPNNVGADDTQSCTPPCNVELYTDNLCDTCKYAHEVLVCFLSQHHTGRMHTWLHFRHPGHHQLRHHACQPSTMSHRTPLVLDISHAPLQRHAWMAPAARRHCWRADQCQMQLQPLPRQCDMLPLWWCDAQECKTCRQEGRQERILTQQLAHGMCDVVMVRLVLWSHRHRQFKT